MTLAGRLDLWMPPITLMGLIFYLSAQPDLSTGLGTWDLVLRKIGHATIYAALFLLWWRALRVLGDEGRAVIAALAISVGYAITDELHQTTVAGRHGSALDVLIDSAGAGAAALWAWRRR